MTDRAGRVVVSVSDSPAGIAALRFAVTEARRRGVPVCAVRTWLPVASWQAPYVWQWTQADCAADAQESIRAALRAAFGAVPDDPPIEVLVTEGPLGEALVGQAREGDLLVVAGPGRRWWQPGGLARYCARRACCPVVLVPAPAMLGCRTARSLARQLRREAEEYVAAWAAELDHPVR